MIEDDRTLALWAEDPDAVDLQPFKDAKAALALPYRCVPRWVIHGDIEHRVIAVGARPPFVCAYALVTKRTTAENLMVVVAWALGELDDDRAMEVADTLSVIFGPGVRELSEDELAGEQAYADYEAGR